MFIRLSYSATYMRGRMPSKILLQFNIIVVMANLLPAGSFQITDGPSKFDFMCSLFDGKTVKISCDTSNNPKFVPILKVIFQHVGAEDGSLESWVGTVMFVDINYQIERRKFYYNSKSRKGVVHERVIQSTTPNPINITNKF